MNRPRASVRRVHLHLVLLGGASAHRQYVDRIPNGDLFMPVWKALGHVSPLPQAVNSLIGMEIANVRFARNSFGKHFAAAGFHWNEWLCREDSDGDGLSNGEELGDPHCVWRPGMPPTRNTTLSHPALAGAHGEWTHLMRHAARLRCRVGVGCETMGIGASDKMQERETPPAWEVAYYHYYVPPLLLLGLLTFLCVPAAPPPRWPIVLFEVYLVCHVGVFIGCHRWASHNAFVATRPLKWLLSILAAWCMQGTPAHWAFLHRLHHRFCDQGVLDLQAPRPPHHLLYGHYGWFTTPVHHFFMSSQTNSDAIIPDIIADPTMPRIGKEVGAAIACHFAILAAIMLGYAAAEIARQRRRRAPLRRAACETAVKTWLVACWYFWLPCAIGFQCVLLVIDAVHMWGDRAFDDAMSAPCDARNNAFLFLPLVGENWHNNHHVRRRPPNRRPCRARASPCASRATRPLPPHGLWLGPWRSRPRRTRRAPGSGGTSSTCSTSSYASSSSVGSRRTSSSRRRTACARATRPTGCSRASSRSGRSAGSSCSSCGGCRPCAVAARRTQRGGGAKASGRARPRRQCPSRRAPPRRASEASQRRPPAAAWRRRRARAAVAGAAHARRVPRAASARALALPGLPHAEKGFSRSERARRATAPMQSAHE